MGLRAVWRTIGARPGLTFVLMGLSFFLFGLCSFNLIVILRANLELFVEHGAMVLADGAGRQLLELMLYGYASVAFWVVFKACEKTLVEVLTGEGE